MTSAPAATPPGGPPSRRSPSATRPPTPAAARSARPATRPAASGTRQQSAASSRTCPTRRPPSRPPRPPTEPRPSRRALFGRTAPRASSADALQLDDLAEERRDIEVAAGDPAAAPERDHARVVQSAGERADAAVGRDLPHLAGAVDRDVQVALGVGGHAVGAAELVGAGRRRV